MIKFSLVIFVFFTLQICGQKTITSAKNIIVENKKFGNGFRVDTSNEIKLFEINLNDLLE